MTFSKLNYINVGEHGTFVGSSTPTADIDALFAELQTRKPSRLVFHFHGGLVAKGAGMKTAQNIHKALGSPSVHVVTFVWETGFWEILTRNLTEVGETGLFSEIRKFVIKKVGEKLGFTIPGGRGFGQITDVEVTIELAKDEPLMQYRDTARVNAEDLTPSRLKALESIIEAELKQEIDANSAIIHLLEKEAPHTPEFNKAEYGIPSATTGETGRGLLTPKIIKGLATVAIRSIRRFVRKTDHDPYPTIIEEIFREFYVGSLGKFVWDNIKEIAEEGTWANNDGLSGDKRRVGAYFMEKLNEFQANHSEVTVDLVGHSAGAIMVCHLLKNAAEPQYKGIHIRNIVFLAPACTSQLYRDEVISKPERFKQFRMYTMLDEFEKKDWVVKVIYPRSLLYLVSGLFEAEVDTPILGMQRFLLDKEPFSDNELLTSVRGYLSEEGRVCFSKSKDDALDGFRSLSVRHGDFDDDQPTLKSIASLIAQD